MENDALAEKKFLETKDKLFQMVESGKMSQEHFINIISELNGKVKVKEGKKKKYEDKSEEVAEANPYKVAMRKQMGLAK